MRSSTTFMRSVRSGKGLPMALLLVCVLSLFAGCARMPMDRLMPHVENMYMATHYFGQPTSKTELSGGGTRSEWLMDRVIQVPGQYVEQKIFMGTDRDGFPRYYIRKVFVPAHMARQYCRLEIVADKNGEILESSWEGDSCEDMMRVPTTY